MILNSFSVAGKNALVTGSTRGLGAAIAIALAEAGANVAVHGRLGTGEDTGSSIRQMGRKTLSLAGDVADPKVCSALIQKAIDEFGSLDILVNNAGMIRRAPAVDYTSADWDQLIATNLSGVFRLSQLAGKHMLQRGEGGKIVNIASLLSFQGGILVPAYAAAKGGVAQLTKALANEWARSGINVNAIAPGYMATDNTEDLRNDPDRSRQIMERIPAAQWARHGMLPVQSFSFALAPASTFTAMCSSWTEGGWLGDAAGYERMKALNIEDLRCAARRRVPRVVFDYIDGGAEGEFTMQENLRAFEQLHFRPRQAVAFTECDLRTRVLGCELSIPVLLAPVGYCRVMHPGGEIAASRAAGKAGAGYILSTVSGHPLEKVKAASGGPAWYQLYLTGGRAAAEQAISRAHNCGYKVLVITIDTIIIGKRERELRSGMEQLLRGSLWSKLPFLPDVLTRPRWLLRYLADGGLPTMPNIVRPGKGPLRISEAHTAMVRSAFTWDDMTWIRQQWRGPIAIKGVLSTDDALRSLDCGASAVIVSNHGGRQLDGVQASLRVLPEIVDAVQGRAEVLFDSGIRRGSDIVKAMCLGAKAVLIGRAFAYGLAAAGEAGVAHALQILRADIDRTLRLLGCHSVRALDKTYLDIPAMWSRNHKPELQSN